MGTEIAGLALWSAGTPVLCQGSSSNGPRRWKGPTHQLHPPRFKENIG